MVDTYLNCKTLNWLRVNRGNCVKSLTFERGLTNQSKPYPLNYLCFLVACTGIPTWRRTSLTFIFYDEVESLRLRISYFGIASPSPSQPSYPSRFSPWRTRSLPIASPSVQAPPPTVLTVSTMVEAPLIAPPIDSWLIASFGDLLWTYGHSSKIACPWRVPLPRN